MALRHAREVQSPDGSTFQETVQGLMAGDFSRLAPLFESPSSTSVCPILKWFSDGLFDTQPEALAEAFTCACFNGCIPVVESLLAKGVDANGGINTGLNAVHWAVNRGQLRIVEILVRNQTPLETRNTYGGTALGAAVWAAVYEPRPDHFQIIETLLKAGADIRAAQYPSGSERVDEILKRHGAREA